MPETQNKWPSKTQNNPDTFDQLMTLETSRNKCHKEQLAKIMHLKSESKINLIQNLTIYTLGHLVCKLGNLKKKIHIKKNNTNSTFQKTDYTNKPVMRPFAQMALITQGQCKEDFKR